MTIFCLLDNLFRDTAPVPFLKFIYHDKNSAVYQTCTATAPADNKNYTMTAKSTPPSRSARRGTAYLSCHRDNFPAKVPGLLRSAQDGRMAAPGNKPPLQAGFPLCGTGSRYPDITCRDLTLGPLYCRAVIGKILKIKGLIRKFDMTDSKEPMEVLQLPHSLIHLILC